MDWKIDVNPDAYKSDIEKENEKLKQEIEKLKSEKAAILQQKDTMAKQYEEAHKFLLNESDQLRRNLNDLQYRYNDLKHKAIPIWLNEESVLKHGITLAPIGEKLYLLKKERIVIRNVMFCGSDKIYKLPKEFELPNKVHIGLHIADNKVYGSGLFYKHSGRWRSYHFAHSCDYICASYPTTIDSLEAYLRAIKFILISFETINLGSVFVLNSRDSFRDMFIEILKEAAKVAPEDALEANGLPAVNDHLFVV